MNDWPKLSGETDAQYVYRVCRNKDEIGTWTDVAEVINKTLGWDKGECAYRKTWKAYQDLQQVSDIENGDTQAMIDELQSERREKKPRSRCAMNAMKSAVCCVRRRVPRVCVS